MIPFLYGDLFKLLKNIFSIIIKPDIMNKYETALKLKEIDLYSSCNHLVAKEIDIGVVALIHIQELRRRDEVSKTLKKFELFNQKNCKKVCDWYY